ncbi:hypothetical protein KAZ66_05465 [Candidatus Woesebacteria bacterium]|nr:hypothetical protein [Candidatus Woesebacteria bacterium]
MQKTKGDGLEKEKPLSVSAGLKSVIKDSTHGTADAIADISRGMFEQLLGSSFEKQENQQEQPNQENNTMLRPEATLFSFRERQEEKEIEELKELIKMIEKEVKEIKRKSNQVLQNVQDIENSVINTHEKEPTMYIFRVLNTFLQLLRSVNLNLPSSSTWMEALQSKKAKRGSLFAARSKKQGTAYSQSQEISNARSVQ